MSRATAGAPRRPTPARGVAWGAGGARARRAGAAGPAAGGAAEALVARAVGRAVRLRDEHFAPVSGRQIVARMLRNLQGAYAKRQAWDRALAVVDRLLVVDGEASVHVRDRGTALVNLGRLHHGAAA